MKAPEEEHTSVEHTVVKRVGRYLLFQEIASGGMASVHFGRLLGEGGFARTVAIKRMHAHLAKDEAFSAAFLDEARLAARIEHPNVIKTLDIVRNESELMIVMEYVVGESLSKLVTMLRKAKQPFPIDVVSAMVSDSLHGLRAAHEASDERGEPMNIVHRDVSPQNLLVGRDGITRVLDFGIAKARGRSQTTQDGQLKGKLAYMAPEQILGSEVDARVDVYAAGIVLWELLTGKHLFAGDNEGVTLTNALHLPVPPPSQSRSEVSPALDSVVQRALARDPAQRFPSALSMAEALEQAVPPATHRKVGAFVEALACESIQKRAEILANLGQTASEALADPDLVQPKKRSIVWLATGFVLLLLFAASVSTWRSWHSAPEATASQAVSESAPLVSVAELASAIPSVATTSTGELVTPHPTRSSVSSKPKPALPPPSPSKGAGATRPSCKVVSFVDNDGNTQFRRVCE